MKQITGERCIELMMEKFPGFLSYWEAYIRDFGSDNGLHIQMLPFDGYTIEDVPFLVRTRVAPHLIQTASVCCI